MEPAFRQPDIAEVFERTLVPTIFEPYARDLIERARPIGPADRVLDLGCGTAIVARLLRDRLGGAAKLTGVDTSAPMLARARAIAPELELVEANAMALPFEAGAFELVISQQMLQFVPDRAAALREVRRVLAPRGRVLVSTWRPRAMQPLHDALGQVGEKHLGASNDKRWCLDGEELHALLVDAGFVGVRVETVSLVEKYPTFPVRMSAMAANFDTSALAPEERERRLAAVEADSAPVLSRFTVDGIITAPSVTNVATARLP